MFEIIFLGTSASIPTDNRSLPATLLIHEGKRFLVDCGEGTQLQLMRAEQGLNIPYIFFTHDHLDHLLGIGGLLFSLSLRRLSPFPHVTIYGGDTTLERVRTLVKMIRSKEGGEIAINLGYVEVSSGIIFGDEQLIISAFRTNHRPRSCFGYTFRQKGKRPFKAKEAESLGVPKGPLCKKLVEGEPVTLSDGKIVYPEQVLGPPTPGTKLVHLGNTGYMDSLIEEAEGADCLIAEATFLAPDSIKAQEVGHLTAVQAATIAREARVNLLCLTHVSRRYSDEQILREAKSIFPNVVLANDLDRIQVAKPHSS